MPKEYNYLSPDGVHITQEWYPTKAKAKAAFAKWMKRFEAQGYYSSNKGKIKLLELSYRCDLVSQDAPLELESFKLELQEQISKLETLVNQMPIKGNSITTCQRFNILHHLKRVELCVNGIEESDLIE